MTLAGKKNQTTQKFLPKKRNSFLTPVNIMFLAGSVMILFASATTTSSLVFSFVTSRTDTSYPTSLPWVENKYECEQFGRTWRNGQCWDGEHSYTF